ncbi:type I-E CRISPR-associated protein Cse2/CasB [Streptomyces sp. NPDC001941]|uniref:type I-E CRISPR-associated protein Cse2/CasB n=1 Tax=Streptomyces sp. NPDC001941 TaxID=3154659 RepID=UPI00332CE7BD
MWEETARHWQQASGEPGRPALPDHLVARLRALREGAGQEPGTVASLRPIHRVIPPDGDHGPLPDDYVAEHYTLTLFGLHQHVAAQAVHQPGAGLGTACLHLRRTNALTHAAAGRRLTAAATAQDVHELAHHLQRLVPFLKQTGIGLDYTRLLRDLSHWDGPGRNRVLRAWGLQYTDPADSSEETSGEDRAPYWSTVDLSANEVGAQLAALRSGTGREAGTVAAMWPFHRTRMASEWRDKGALTRDLVAEHLALTLFARHQQTHVRLMHVPGNSPGTAAGQLAKATAGGGEGKSVTGALERRFGTLLTSVDTNELGAHLRSLIPQLSKAGIGVDYDLLRAALRVWDDPRHPDAAATYRQRWDRDFYTAATS